MTELRKQGYKIRVTHFRRTQFGEFPNREIQEANAKMELDRSNVPKFPYIIQPCGGRVVVEIVTPEGHTISATAECSRRDNFKRTVGTAIAFGRAVKELERVQRVTNS